MVWRRLGSQAAAGRRPHPGEPGQHLVPGGQRATPSTWCSRWCPSARWPARRDSPRTRVRRADQGHQLLRQPGQQVRRHQRAQDPPDHHQLRPHQRVVHAGPVQDLDRGFAGRLRRAGRHRGLDRRQPAVHHPGGPHALHRAVDHGHQLDQPGFALPVVDRPGPVGHPAGRGQLGAERRPAGRQPQGGRGGRRPGLGPAGPEAVPPARSPAGRDHRHGQDHRLGPERLRHHQHPGPPGDPGSSAAPG